MLWPQKNSYKEFLRLENSPPPHNFSNGPSLKATVTRHLSSPTAWLIMTTHCHDQPLLLAIND